MIKVRVIPCLLLQNNKLVKTVSFKNPRYIGDPINAVRIFNEKEADELIIIDIEASKVNKEPDYGKISEITSESFMPLAYGGGIKNLDQIQKLIGIGIEKVIINSAILYDYNLIRETSDIIGSQSIVVAVDVKRDWLGQYRLFNAINGKIVKKDILEHINMSVKNGAGEIFINDVDYEGTGKGYDINLLKLISKHTTVPIISCGGAGTLEHLREAVNAGVTAVAAGSMFVYVGKHRAVMINYPNYNQLEELFKK